MHGTHVQNIGRLPLSKRSLIVKKKKKKKKNNNNNNNNFGSTNQFETLV